MHTRQANVFRAVLLLCLIACSSPPPASQPPPPHPAHEGPCDASECGPAPGMPSTACADGSIAGPVCARSTGGACGWAITECPSASAPPAADAAARCARAGCSGTICVEAAKAAEIMTTCEYRPEHACYQSARCEPQADQSCGWTKTAELDACLASPPPP